MTHGRPTLRTPEGEQGLQEGDVVCFPARQGGRPPGLEPHGLADPGADALDAAAPDVVEYLDSGKVGARSVAGERILLSCPGPMLDYWDGED